LNASRPAPIQVESHSRSASAAVAPQKPLKPLSIFYGYPPELIARWCGVSVATARRWKRAGGASRSALRLFTLHRDQRVLDEHWIGWTLHKGVLTDPEGNSATQGQLRAYAIVVQLIAEQAKTDPEARERYLAILRSA
jgi:hypothetical protein